MPLAATLPSRRPDSGMALVRWLVLLWVMMLVVGIVVLRLPTALRASTPLSFNLSLFTATNVSTLTGFAQSNAQPNEYALFTQLVFFLQMLSGALLCLVGGGILVSRVIDSRHDDRRIGIAALVMVTFAALLGAASISSGEGFLSAASRGLGALCCSGLVFGPPHGPGDIVLLALLYPLSVLGSLGTIVVLDIWDAFVLQKPMSDHAWHVLRVFGITYVAAVVVMTLLLLVNGSILEIGFIRASTLVLCARGYGQPVAPLTGPAAFGWIIPAIMLVGAGTLGTTGGFGFAWIVTLPAHYARRVMKSFLLLGAILLLMLIMLSESETTLKPMELLTMVVSGGMNVGLSHHPVSVDGNSLIVMSMLMIAGRLLPFAVLFAMVTDQPGPTVSDRPRFPARQIVDN